MITVFCKTRRQTAVFPKSVTIPLLATLFALVTSSVLAQTTGLTPSGAEQAGTASGIPAWSSPEPMTPGWSYGKPRKDFFLFKSDVPLYTIDASNVDKYMGLLNPGQAALVKGIKGYSMPVYPSRRTCGVPDFVAENTKKNVGFAKMSTDDTALANAYTPGIPFLEPKTGAEAMWNAKMRYRGVGMELSRLTTSISPRKGGSDWIKLTSDLYTYMPWATKSGTKFADAGNVEAMTYFSYVSPVALAGQAATYTSSADKPAEVFYYFPGQRRTRRMPTYSYDAPQIGFENQYNVDESYTFSGLLDRFDWKLVGKKEMVVPYNALGMYDFNAKHEDVLQPEFVAAAQRRYELHRVWVVEATVKQGMRHSAPKRTFYIDEDSWALLGAVDYDAQGNISKVREGYVIPVYETGTCDSLAFAQYNLSEGRYLVDGSPIGSGKDIKWIVDGAGNPHMKAGFYTTENLRAMSER